MSMSIKLPIYWGNRNWDPFLADAMRQMQDDGVKHALGLVTSAYSSVFGLPAVSRECCRRASRSGRGRAGGG